jgi:Uma2 family endonuclease
MSAANQLPDQMTVIEFLAWNLQDSDRWELIDGTLRAMAPATRHGAIQGEVNPIETWKVSNSAQGDITGNQEVFPFK